MALSEIIWMIMMMERRPNGMALLIVHVLEYVLLLNLLVPTLYIKHVKLATLTESSN